MHRKAVQQQEGSLPRKEAEEAIVDWEVAVLAVSPLLGTVHPKESNFCRNKQNR